MSPLTKALVVLVTVLAILELGMFVAYTAKHQQLSQSVQNLQSQLTAAQQTARAAQAEVNAAQDRQNETIADLNAQIASLTNQLTEARTARREAESQIQSERARNDKTEAAIARLTAAAQQDAVLREALNEELKSTRAELVDLRTRNVELADAVNERTSTSEAQVRQLRRYAEQLSETNRRTEQLESAIVAAGGTVPGEAAETQYAAQPDRPISGQVTQVDTSGGVPLVAINVGRNDGVAEGMEFMVHRGTNYLGKLVVENVDADQSAGRMTLVRDDVRPQDEIYAGPF